MPTRGIVAAGDPQTANAGAELLRAGGNAVDAAVAAACAAFVCELPLCSPLGGAAMLLELSGSGSGSTSHALDLFARAPGLDGTRPAELDFDDVEVSFGAANQVFHVGRGSAAVPLALAGLLEAHRRWGRRPLEEVVSPAVDLGRNGYLLGPGVAFVFKILTPIIERTPECRALFADKDGSIAKHGARLDNRDLAATLERIGRRPETLAEISAALAHEFGPAAGGLITERDLERAAVVDVAPIRTEHAGYELLTMPGPSTGGALVALGLSLSQGLGKTEFLSRDHVLGTARVQETLLAERLRLENQLGSTTHLSVIDEEGGAVALTLTNGEGCGHVLSGTGMVVNNLLGEEDIHPHGFHRDPPGSALSTMMAPTLLRRGGDRIALGSGGSNRLRNAILQVLVGLIEHGRTPDEAVRAPRLQLEAPGGTPKLAFEATGLAPEVADALRARYPDDAKVFNELNLYFGGVHLARRIGDIFDGAGDPRRGGALAIV